MPITFPFLFLRIVFGYGKSASRQRSAPLIGMGVLVLSLLICASPSPAQDAPILPPIPRNDLPLTIPPPPTQVPDAPAPAAPAPAPPSPAPATGKPTPPAPAPRVEEPAPPAPDSGIDQEVLNGFDTATPAERIELLNLYDRLGNQPMVRELSERILKDAPDDPKALETLAIAALKSKNRENSLLYTGRLMEIAPTRENRLMRVSALQLDGRNADAVSILKKLKEESETPVFPQQQDLAFALLETGQTEAAKAAFKEIITVAGYSPAVVAEAEKQLTTMRFVELLESGYQAIKEKDAETARDTLETLLTEFPKANGTRDIHAQVLILEGRHSDALVILENLKKENRGKVFEGQNAIGYIFVEMKDWDVARSEFRTVLDTPGYSPEAVAQAREAMAEIDLYERLEQGYQAAKMRDRKTVREIADWAIQNYPKNPDVRAFEAKALALEGDYNSALEILTQLERLTPPGQPYGNVWGLGEALYETGDFNGAAEKFSTFAKIPNRKPSERLDAFFSLQQLKADYFGQFRASATTFFGEEGDSVSPEVYARTNVNGHGWRADAIYHRDEISLSDTVLRDSTAGLQDGGVGFEKFFGNAKFVRARIGASDNDALGGLWVGKSARTLNSAWQLGVAINDRATDSLTLRALDGREDHVEFDFMREVTERFQIAFDAFARRIDIRGQKLGTGYGANVDVAYRLNHEWSRSNIALAYTASYSRFDTESSWVPGSGYDPSKILGISNSILAADLVEPEYHRHGIELRLGGLIGTTLVPYASAGAHYRFDGIGFEYGVAGGFEWFLTPDTTLGLDASFYSSGQAANAGAGTLEAAAFLRHAF